MATIKISDLYPTGLELFQDSESFLNKLAEEQSDITYGGQYFLGLHINRPIWSVEPTFPIGTFTIKTVIIRPTIVDSAP